MTCDSLRFQSGRARRTTGRGFTLVELLLTLVLILLLAAAAVFNLSSLQRGARLDEGAAQFEALLRFARAQAASSGRIVQVVCEEASASTSTSTNAAAAAASLGTNLVLSLRWEPDPLGAPGVFEPLPQTPTFLAALEDLVAVVNVHLLDGSSSTSPAAPGFGSPGSGPATSSGTNSTVILAGDESTPVSDASQSPLLPPAITFYPDGSSDSAEFVIISQDEEDPRRLAIRLAGLTGAIQRHRVPREGEPPEAVEEEESDSAGSDLTRAEAPAP